MLRIRINRTHDHPLDADVFDGVRARRRTTVGATRFKRHVERRPAWIVAALAGVVQCLGLRMRRAGTAMPALADYFPAFDQHSADHRVG